MGLLFNNAGPNLQPSGQGSAFTATKSVSTCCAAPSEAVSSSSSTIRVPTATFLRRLRFYRRHASVDLLHCPIGGRIP